MEGLPPPDKPRYVAAMFARIVRRYDLMNAIMTLGRHSEWRRQTVALAAPPDRGLVLDVAAGTGDLALAAANTIAAPLVVALDFSAKMLDVAKRKAGGSSRVVSVLADALNLPFPDAAFDCVTMGFGLRNVSGIQNVLAEIHRVLKPAGRLANIELTHMPPGLKASVFHAYFNCLVPLIGGLISGDQAAYSYLPRSLHGFPTARELSDIMRGVGFENVSFDLVGGGAVAIHCARKPS